MVSDPWAFFSDWNVDDYLGGLCDVAFNIDDVMEAFKSMKAGSAPGPDAFPSVLLKECAHELAPAFSKIFRRSLDTGIVPKPLKHAKIVPIYKGGSKQVPKNYRPIALTSHIAKAMEKIVRKAIVSYLEGNNILNPNQHGFHGGHSTLSQLLSHAEEITHRMEEGALVDVVYLDFSKAFDKVDHGILLKTCRDVGISGKLGVWLHGFLTNREQYVSTNGSSSDVAGVRFRSATRNGPGRCPLSDYSEQHP